LFEGKVRNDWPIASGQMFLQMRIFQTLQDVSAFNGVVSLLSFSPFKMAAEALANINAVSEGLLTEQVASFLSFIGTICDWKNFSS